MTDKNSPGLDYYQLLKVPKSATVVEIKKAFHELALLHHPDRNSDPNSEKVRTLSSPLKWNPAVSGSRIDG